MSKPVIVEKLARVVVGVGKKSGKEYTAVDAKVVLDDGTVVVFDRKFVGGDDGEWE